MGFREFDKSVHRYELDHSKPRRKLTCPQCGRDRCFTPYVDVTTGQIVGAQFGVCDHKINVVILNIQQAMSLGAMIFLPIQTKY